MPTYVYELALVYSSQIEKKIAEMAKIAEIPIKW